MSDRVPLAHLPTPLWHSDALDRLVGVELWVKRDDMTAGAEAGNKIRKLEFLLADALARGARTVLTCGAVQSNHARATALCAVGLGMRPVLFLRAADPSAPGSPVGNLMLDRLAGAELRFITVEQYRERNKLMAEAAAGLEREGREPYVIPEGGSNGIGARGYLEAMREVRAQLDLGLGGGPDGFDAVVHACGSGGTAAGIVLGARRFDVAPVVHTMAVCDDRAYFESVIGRIVLEAVSKGADGRELARLVVHDAFTGPAYGVASDEQLSFIMEVARRSGLVLDPVYSGKALFGLSRMEDRPRRVLFIHTGGLPGLLAQSAEFAG